MTGDAPEPFTPPDCDLRGLPFMPLDIVRLFDSDAYALSTGDEFKAALSLWGKAFLQVPAGSLPDDDRVLAHLSGAGGRWRKVKAMALHGFVKCSDGRLYHPVVCEKALEAWAHRQRQRERAAKRWHQSGNATEDATAHAAADAAASPAAMQGTGTVKGQLRESKNPSPTAQVSARGSRFDLEKLPEDWREFCKQERPELDPDRVFAEFRDYWIARAGKDARKLDWFATWRNRVRGVRTTKASLFDAPKPATLDEIKTWGR